LPLRLPWDQISQRIDFNRNAVAPFANEVEPSLNVATALRLVPLLASIPRVAEAATLGCETQPLWGLRTTDDRLKLKTGN
jgi:hypothetical protein